MLEKRPSRAALAAILRRLAPVLAPVPEAMPAAFRGLPPVPEGRAPVLAA